MLNFGLEAQNISSVDRDPKGCYSLNRKAQSKKQMNALF